MDSTIQSRTASLRGSIAAAALATLAFRSRAAGLIAGLGVAFHPAHVRLSVSESPMVLAYTKQAIRAVRGMDMDQAYEYLGAKSMALRAADPEQTRGRGMREFLDEKKFRPGLEPLKRQVSEK